MPEFWVFNMELASYYPPVTYIWRAGCGFWKNCGLLSYGNLEEFKH
jgi:hypothetical protein